METDTPPNPQQPLFLGFIPPLFAGYFIIFLIFESLSLLTITPCTIYCAWTRYPQVRQNRHGLFLLTIILSIIAGILAPPVFLIAFGPLALVLTIQSKRVERLLKEMKENGLTPTPEDLQRHWELSHPMPTPGASPEATPVRPPPAFLIT